MRCPTVEEVVWIAVNHRRLLGFLFFNLLTIMPFLSAIRIMGIDNFIDSFENADYYTLLNLKDSCIIIQSSNHPEFTVEREDVIIYRENGRLSMGKIYKIGALGSYVVLDEDIALCKGDIVGKVIKKLDKNMLNKISITLWDISIHNLNIKYVI